MQVDLMPESQTDPAMIEHSDASRMTRPTDDGNVVPPHQHKRQYT